jgi:flagellar protein FlbD
MINLTRLNQQAVVVNASHIVTVETTPDTLVTLFNGERLLVRESAAEIQRLVIEYLRRVGWVAMLVRADLGDGTRE